MEAADRADLGEHLGGSDWSAAGQLEQGRRERGGALLELMVELGDLAVEPAAARDELPRESHLELLVLAGKPARDPLQVQGAGEHPQRHLVGRVELVQVPAQPLMDASALVDDRVAVIDEQLRLAVRLLVRPRPTEFRFADRCPRNGERVDRVRLARARPCRRSGAISFGGTRTSSSPAASN